MKNIIILGTGRSGTSMVAGCFSNTGYFMGEELWPGTISNPKGFFEDREINSINEELLAQSSGRGLEDGWLFRRKSDKYWGWLFSVDSDMKFKVGLFLRRRIKKITAEMPFCLKDPRFNYTLPAWRPFLSNTVFICVFREPQITVESILKETESAEYLSDFSISREQAYALWESSYENILDNLSSHGDWIFTHYEQILNQTKLKEIALVIGASLDYSFPDKKYQRSFSNDSPPLKSQSIYKKLCERAGYKN